MIESIVTPPKIAPRWMRFVMRLDYLQIVSMLILLAYGITFIYGSGYQHEINDSSIYWIRQLQWVGVGFGLWIFFTVLNYRYLGYFSPLLYAGSIVLLVVVLIWGTRYYGATRWLDLGPIHLQPSELAKFGFLAFAAWLFAVGLNPNKVMSWGIIGLLSAVPFYLIFVEPDLGTALVIVFLAGVLLFATGLKWRWLILALALFCVAVPLSYQFLRPHHKARIEAFLDPDIDPQGKGWTARQAQLSVGSGGLAGKGFTKGTLHTLGYLPKTVSNSDFIFSVIAEETGFIGCSIFILCYFLLITSALRTAYVAPDMFGRLLALGIAAIFFMHSLVNIGMNIRLFPITGMPLPLVSYGGTFMVTCLVYLGILQSIYVRRRHSLFSSVPDSAVDDPPTL